MEKKPARRIGAKPPPDRAPRSIYCFSVKNPFRKKCIEFVEWKPFEFLILLTILGNCVALAVYTPFPAEDTNEMNLILVRQTYSMAATTYMHGARGRRSIVNNVSILAFKFGIYTVLYLYVHWHWHGPCQRVLDPCTSRSIMH